MAPRNLLLLLTLVAPLSAQVPSSLKPELAPLAYFLGTWDCSGQFANKRPIDASMVFRTELDGAWLTRRHDDLPPNPFHSSELWGFDKKANQFVAVMADIGGGVRLFRSPGWEQNRLVLSGDQLTTGSPVTQRFMFDKQATNQFVVTYQVTDGSGDWKPVDALTCKLHDHPSEK